MQTVNLKSKEALKLPILPGVYLIKNSQNKILYVGKAKILRSRVKSYFSSSDSSLKNRFLIRQMKKVDYIVTANEEEACLLEASLIKKHKPRYNVRLKDDKAYPYIRCSVQDDFPRLYFERKVKDHKSLYFGPYTQSGAVRAIMIFLNHTFQLRDCTDSNFKTRERPCLTHQMGFCTAPCVELTNKKEYKKQFQRAVQFLKGRHIGLVKNLKIQMKQRAEELRFEEAARLRESLKAVEMIEQDQLVIQESELDQDVICALSDKYGFLIEFLYLRKGRLIGTHYRFFKTPFDKEIFFSFLNQYYGEHLIPDEILINPPLKKSQFKLMERVLSLRKESPCQVNTPKKEKDKALMDRARQNAENHLKDAVRQEKSQREILEEIQKKFHLPFLPLRMECYDISHWQGKGTVGSQAVFENGQLKKEDYRLYGLKEAAPSDDYGSLREVLTRRLLHTEYEDPHLLIIDGGKGQLSAAQKVLEDIGRQDIPMVALAKDRPLYPKKNQDIQKGTIPSSGERFYLPGRKNPVLFKSSPAFHLLLHIRDEAHRFAVETHRKKRDKQFLSGDLDQIPGLGPKRKQSLLKKFGSLENIKQASEKELTAIPSISPKLAREIKKHFDLKV